MLELKPLPADALALLDDASISPRLLAHLTLVHDTASYLLIEMHREFPGLAISDADVLFGAATHDIGKIDFPQELSASGKSHEQQGVVRLRMLGVPEHRSRFAFTHGNWNGSSSIRIEDLLVSLADNCWKGKRVSDLEELMVKALSMASGKPEWEVFSILDNVLQELSADADERLAWQNQFPVTKAHS